MKYIFIDDMVKKTHIDFIKCKKGQSLVKTVHYSDII